MRNINPYDLNGSDRRALRNYLSGDTTGKNYDINQLKGLSTKYNWGLKFQQGGQITMNEEQQMQQAFLQYLAEQTGAKSEQELEQVIQQLGEDGLKQAYTQFVQAMQQQQVQAAKFGAKLNYIKQLKG
jgi:preprotein translocase subunit SecF